MMIHWPSRRKKLNNWQNKGANTGLDVTVVQMGNCAMNMAKGVDFTSKSRQRERATIKHCWDILFVFLGSESSEPGIVCNFFSLVQL